MRKLCNSETEDELLPQPTHRVATPVHSRGRAPPAAAARLPTPVVRRWRRRRRERDALKSPSTGVRAVKHRSDASEAAGARVQSTEKGEGGWWFSKMTFETTDADADASLSRSPLSPRLIPLRKNVWKNTELEEEERRTSAERASARSEKSCQQWEEDGECQSVNS